MMVRPGNLVLAVWTVGVLIDVLARAVVVPQSGRGRLLLVSLAAAVVFLVSLVPQQQLNSELFGESTMMPVADLGESQLRAGLRMIRCATDVRDPRCRVRSTSTRG
jgi:hypothetical protein